MIIDMRCRVTAGAAGEYARSRLGAKAGRAVREGTEEAFFRELDAAGVTVAISPGGNNQGMELDRRTLPPRVTSNDEQAALAAKYPQRLVGVAAIDVGNAAHNALEELERCVKVLGLKVATIEPGREPMRAPHPADPRIYDFYALAQSLEVPIIVQTSGLLGGKNIDYAHPRWIDQVAEDFPQLTIICGHGCYPYVREMIVVSMRRKNVYASPDMYVLAMGSDDWVRSINRGRMANKFIFGSAFPFCGDLRRFVARFLTLGWKPEVLDRILYRNALRALRLEDDERFRERAQGKDIFGRSTILRAGAARAIDSVTKAWK